MARKGLWLTVAVLALWLAGCVTTQKDKEMQTSVSDLQQRLETLERENKDLKNRFDQSTRVAGDAVIGFENLQNEVQILAGRFDEVAQSSKMTEKQLAAIRLQLANELRRQDQRLSVLEGKAGIKDAERGNLDNFGAVTPGGEPVEKLSEDDVFQQGLALFNQGNLEAAKAKFQEFLAQFKQSKKRDEAQFYIAECNFKQNNWMDAILEFDNLTSKYPKSKRVPAAYLHTAIAFYESGQLDNAKLYFEKVVELFPGSKEAQIADKKLKQMKK